MVTSFKFYVKIHDEYLRKVKATTYGVILDPSSLGMISTLPFLTGSIDNKYSKIEQKLHICWCPKSIFLIEFLNL